MGGGSQRQQGKMGGALTRKRNLPTLENGIEQMESNFHLATLGRPKPLKCP